MGGGGGGGWVLISGRGANLDYVIRGGGGRGGGRGGGWVLITVDDRGGRGTNCQNIDFVICERPLSSYLRCKAAPR